jgi:hypothetical protein
MKIAQGRAIDCVPLAIQRFQSHRACLVSDRELQRRSDAGE